MSDQCDRCHRTKDLQWVDLGGGDTALLCRHHIPMTVAFGDLRRSVQALKRTVINGLRR